MQKIFEGLNEAQKEAVKKIDGSVLILAGAGSGKTKTIISRLAYLLEVKKIPPQSILTLTFTNKSAIEMRDKAMNLIDSSSIAYPPLVCTFHRFGLIFLRQYIHTINRQNDFFIADSNDKKSILRKLIRDLNLDLPTEIISLEISKYKNFLIEPEIAIKQAIIPYYKNIAKIYRKYSKILIEKNLLDFDDLSVLTYQILSTNKNILKKISSQYQYLMVDEYQDTNQIQSLIIKKIASTHKNLCVVGDDDQSIYGCMGASVANILNFKKENKDCKIIKLELNYRSTKNILSCANRLIQYNRSRVDKKLVATKPLGKDIDVMEFFNEKNEANSIAEKIKDLISKGVAPKDIAIIYRLSSLSRSLEEVLNNQKIPYKTINGLKFYNRTEVKDIISYFRVVSNINDDHSINRIINKPRRGIGKTSLNTFERLAKEKNLSMYNYIKNHKDELFNSIGKRAHSSIINFFDSILILQSRIKISIENLIDDLEKVFKIKGYFDNVQNSVGKISNINEFYGLFKDKIKENPELTIDDFLNELSLDSEQDFIDDKNISLMSIYSSKGLEFDYLFVIGLENGFFPLLGDESDIEEERRLAYVTFTRAKKELFLSYCQTRLYRGERREFTKSPFLQECGVCRGAMMIKNKRSFKIGDLIKHKIFGMGRILNVQKEGRKYKLTINFAGIKKEIMDSFVEKI